MYFTKWITLIMTPLLSLISNNWILIWAFLEFSSFSFLSIIKSKSNNEDLMKYFIIQSIASIIILLTLNLKMNSNNKMNYINLLLPPLMIAALATKSGLTPFHVWAPEITKKMNWKSLFIFLSVQKMAPIFLLTLTLYTSMILLIAVMSSLLGTIMQLSTMNLKILMVYSSISHSSWMVIGGLLLKSLIMIYFLIYTMILLLIINYSIKTNMKFIVSNKKSSDLMIIFLSFSGIPPLLGFMPKWLILIELFNQMHFINAALIMILMSCLNTFIYMRIFSTSTMNSPKKDKTYMKNDYMSTLINIVPMILIIVNTS